MLHERSASLVDLSNRDGLQRPLHKIAVWTYRLELLREDKINFERDFNSAFPDSLLTRVPAIPLMTPFRAAN